MTTVAVVCHAKKSMGGGLDELRSVLAHEGVEPLWFEVPKSRKAPAASKKAVRDGADLVFVWGGDGTVQRCLDAVADDAGRRRDPARRHGQPAGHQPRDPHHDRGGRAGRPPRPTPAARPRRINGEHFAVMAGAGLDALMIRDADRGLKDKAGRLAYVWTGVRNVKVRLEPMTIEVDGNVGSTTRPAACWSPTSARCWRARRVRERLARRRRARARRGRGRGRGAVGPGLRPHGGRAHSTAPR